MLYDATTAEFISSTDVKNACVELKKYLPDDFRANFYEIAVGNNERRLTSAIRKIDVEANFDEIGNIVSFLIKSLQPGFVLELNNLVERAYKGRDLQAFERFSTEISIQAEKVEQGIYETKLPREVFVAYSSKDMDKVSELVEVLEAQGIKCFVAARNLRHGKGAVENYDAALKDAMDHCKSFVFVSSLQSRSFSCDAVKIEIPYIESQDKLNSPPEYRNNYTAIPHQYKKPRVEYRIEQSSGFNAADQITGEFFDGYEWALSPEEVAVRISKQLFEVPVVNEVKPEREAVAPSPAPAVAPKPAAPSKKYCIHCGTEVDKSGTICPKCARREFADSIGDYIKIKNQRDLEERKRKEIAAAAARAVRSQGSVVSGGTTPNRGVSGGATGSTGNISTDSGKKKKKKLGCGSFILIAIAVIAAISIIAGIIDSSTVSDYNPNDGLGGNGGIYNDDWIIQGGDNSQYPETPTFVILPGETEKSPNPDQEDEFISGEWGDVKYSIDMSTHTLTISGEGEVPSYYDTGWGYWTEYGIESLVVGEGITAIGEQTFANMPELTTVILASSVERIGSYSFSSSNIQSIDAPGVKVIESYAFAWCDDLAFVNFDSVTDIGDYAFQSCTALKSISLPSINRIGYQSFWESGLEEISVGDDFEYMNLSFENTPFYNAQNVSEQPFYVGNYLVDVPDGYEGVFEIRPGTVSIMDYAFSGCTSIDTVIIPQEITKIGCGAFSNTYYIEQLIFVGTEEQWNQIAFEEDWDYSLGMYTSTGTYAIYYLDGNYNPTENDEYTEGLQFQIDYNAGQCYITGFDPNVNADNSSKLDVVIPSVYMGYPVTKILSYAFKGDAITSVKIPASVKVIEEEAFRECHNLAKVELADESKLETIGKNAFYDCDALESIAIPASVRVINATAFGYCDNLASIIIPKDSMLETIGNYAFVNNVMLTEIFIPATVTAIGESAFNHCTALGQITFADGIQLELIPNSMANDTGLTSIIIPASVKKIGENAFAYCASLSSLEFASGSQLEHIGVTAFAYCEKLTTATLPSTLLGMESNAFYSSPVEYLAVPANINVYLSSYGSYWSALKTLVINGGDTFRAGAYGDKYGVEVLIIGDTVTAIEDNALQQFSSLKSLTVGAGVKTIGASSISHCSALETVTFTGTSVTSIADNAFYNCSALTSIVIPEGVQTVGASAFYSCDVLEEVVLPSTLTSIGKECFYSCDKLKYVTFSGTSLNAIYENTFYNCNSLLEITLTEGVESIGTSAFQGCTSLAKVILPQTLVSISNKAFYGCESLETLTLPEIGGIEQYTFYESGIKSIALPDSVQYVESYAFGYCYDLEEIVIPGTISKDNVSDYAFYYASNIKKATLPTDVVTKITRTNLEEVVLNGGTRVNASSFSGCQMLRKVTFNEGLEQINNNAFYGCSSLMSVVIPESVESCSTSAFTGCIRLVEVIDKSQSKVANKVENCLYSGTEESIIDYVNDFAFITTDEGTYLIGYVGTSTELTLPESYNGEGYMLFKNAFVGCNATSLVIGGVEDIVENAFNGCTSLKTLVIGDSVLTIGQGAFSGCSDLESVVIGNNVVSIGDSAFRYAYALTEVKIGSSVRSIGSYAFSYCTALGKIYIPASVETIGGYAFQNCSMLGSLRFEDPNGFWRYSGDGQNEIEEMDFTDPAVNVDYFVSNYTGYSWKKKTTV